MEGRFASLRTVESAVEQNSAFAQMCWAQKGGMLSFFGIRSLSFGSIKQSVQAFAA